jgi:ribosomal protein S18 acetylase RimI-like enzyme
MALSIEIASFSDAPAIAQLEKELLEEIMTATDQRHFEADFQELMTLAKKFIEEGKSIFFIAKSGEATVGFIALYESHALYAGGSYGTISELFVRKEKRSQGIGKRLLSKAREYSEGQDWKSFEVTTPPLPEFRKTVDFYRKYGFEIAGGRKMKLQL